MKASDWIALTAIVVTLLVTGASLIYARIVRRDERISDDARLQVQQEREDRMRVAQLEREDGMRAAQLQREDAFRAIRGEDVPHIEFELGCHVHGREEGQCLVEFVLVARNRGLVRWKFKSIVLRVRGIEKDQPLEQWRDQEPRLDFPVVVIDDARVIPRNLNFLFVDPGVSQSINYVSPIAISIKYILVHAEFHYDKFTPHSAERVFRLGHTGGTEASASGQ